MQAVNILSRSVGGSKGGGGSGGGTLPPYRRQVPEGIPSPIGGGPPHNRQDSEGIPSPIGGGTPHGRQDSEGIASQKKVKKILPEELEAEGRLGVGGLGGRSPPNGRDPLYII